VPIFSVQKLRDELAKET
jgi:alpha-ketoglutarate-dependent taurine dioxygenase